MTLRVAGLELDLVRHRASRDGKRLDLTPKEFLLLSLLMRKAGEVLSRAYIADQVWDINFESNTNFVDVHITAPAVQGGRSIPHQADSYGPRNGVRGRRKVTRVIPSGSPPAGVEFRDQNWNECDS